MNSKLCSHAKSIVSAAIRAVQPGDAVRRALQDARFPGRLILVATGKAAQDTLGNIISGGTGTNVNDVAVALVNG